jgi:hypothetical protein
LIVNCEPTGTLIGSLTDSMTSAERVAFEDAVQAAMQAADFAMSNWVIVGAIARDHWKTYAELKKHKGEIVNINK